MANRAWSGRGQVCVAIVMVRVATWCASTALSKPGTGKGARASERVHGPRKGVQGLRGQGAHRAAPSANRNERRAQGAHGTRVSGKAGIGGGQATLRCDGNVKVPARWRTSSLRGSSRCGCCACCARTRETARRCEHGSGRLVR